MYLWSGNTVQKGSTGWDAIEVQKFLQEQGYYKGDIDGDFGDKSVEALEAYQEANGLDKDGIFGKNTAAAAGFKNFTTNYDTSKYDESQLGNKSKEEMNRLIGQIYGTYNPETGKYEGGINPYNFSKNTDLTEVYNGIKDYGEFSYDINQDALYQQMAERYQQQGKLAMQDTVGQAAAMTGGYGNSYAQSAGQQAYYAHLEKLNDIAPELYQMALDRYKMGKEDLYDQYGLLMNEDARERQAYMDDYAMKLDQLGLASDTYYKGADMFYTDQAWKETVRNDSKVVEDESGGDPPKDPEPYTKEYYEGWTKGDFERYILAIRRDNGDQAAADEVMKLVSKGILTKDSMLSYLLLARGYGGLRN